MLWLRCLTKHWIISLLVWYYITDIVRCYFYGKILPICCYITDTNIAIDMLLYQKLCTIFLIGFDIANMLLYYHYYTAIADEIIACV